MRTHAPCVPTVNHNNLCALCEKKQYVLMYFCRKKTWRSYTSAPFARKSILVSKTMRMGSGRFNFSPVLRRERAICKW